MLKVTVSAAPPRMATLSGVLETVPEKVTVQWQLFSERIREVPGASIDPVGSHAVLQTVDAPVMEWRRSHPDFGTDPIEPVAVPGEYLLI